MKNISIIIPTYERPDVLRRALESLRNQTYKDYEVIVIDDFSSKKEEYHHVMEKYKNVFSKLIYLRNESNHGLVYTRNRGIEHSKGELIAFLDDDDEWLPTKLEKQLKVFQESNDDVGIVYTWADVIRNQREITHRYRDDVEGNALREILSGNFMTCSSVMVRKKAIIAAGLFDVTFPPLGCQDWDMWTGIFLKGYKCKVVKSVETIIHKEGRSFVSSKLSNKGHKKYYSKYFFHTAKIDKKLFLKFFLRNIKYIFVR